MAGSQIAQTNPGFVPGGSQLTAIAIEMFLVFPIIAIRGHRDRTPAKPLTSP